MSNVLQKQLYVKQNCPVEFMLFKGDVNSYNLHDELLFATLNYVEREQFNEYVDVTKSIYKLVIKKDLNNVVYKNYLGYNDIMYKEYDFYSSEDAQEPSGKIAYFIGGLYQKDPFNWVDQFVKIYMNEMKLNTSYQDMLNLFDIHRDNPWVRVIISTTNFDSIF